MRVSSVRPDEPAQDEEVEIVRRAVSAAEDELVTALRFYEAWLPAATDVALMDRLGSSYATQTFEVIRFSLQRELLLAIMRFWDKDPRAIRLTDIREKLRNKDFVSRLLDDRTLRLAMRSKGVRDRLEEDLVPKFAEIVRRIGRYLQGGDLHENLEKMRAVRHERLAHRQVVESASGTPSLTKAVIEKIFFDTIEIVQLLMSAINGKTFAAKDAGSIFRHNAKYFWMAVRGERTRGHPAYRGDVRATLADIPEMTFQIVADDSVDRKKPLLYMWEIFDKDSGASKSRYVGKAAGGSKRPERHYKQNVRRLLADLGYRAGNPHGYRDIHHALAEATTMGDRIFLNLLRNVREDENIYQAERAAIVQYAANLNRTKI